MAIPLGQTQLCLSDFFSCPLWSIWQSWLLTGEGFQSLSPGKIHFLKLYFTYAVYFILSVTAGVPQDGDQGRV